MKSKITDYYFLGIKVFSKISFISTDPKKELQDKVLKKLTQMMSQIYQPSE
jgi:hypothetical protein